MKKLAQCITMLTLSQSSYADELFFNPAFFKDQGEDIDFSAYEKLMQPTGINKVNVYLNNIFLQEKDINFIRAKEGDNISGDNQGLYPCIFPELINHYLIDQILNRDNDCLNLSEIHDSSIIKYNFLESKLNLYIPQALLKNTHELVNKEKWDDGLTAGFVNYDFTSSTSFNKNYQSFLGLQTGFNLGSWRLRSNSSLIFNKNSTYKKINNYNNYIEKSIPDIRSNLIIGENYTSNMIFDTLSFQGFKLSTANEMLTNSMQGFAPDISGIAQTEANVVIKQNGNIVYRSSVPAGPFKITDLNAIGSSGDLEVLIEESDGSTQVQKIPFSVLPILKRVKRFDYEFTAGKFHSNNASQNDAYFTQGSFYYGFNNLLTLYGGLQLSSKYKSSNLGFGTNLGNYGAFSSDITYANSDIGDVKKHNGLSLRFLYSKNLNKYGTSINLIGYRYSNKDYFTFKDTTYKNSSGYDYNYTLDENGNTIETPIAYYNLNNNSKSNFQFNFSQNLKSLGSLGISKSSHSYWNTSRKSESNTISYSKYIKGFSFNSVYNEYKTFGIEQKQKYISFGLSIPLGQSFTNKGISNLNTNVINDANGNSYSTSLGGRKDNLQYNINTVSSANYSDSFSANINLSHAYGSLSTSYWHTNTNDRISTALRGGSLLHSKGITFGQTIGETTALIKTEDAKGIEIANRKGITTNSKGYAIIPNLQPYVENKVILDLKNTNSNVDIANNIKSVIPTKGAIVLSEFDTKIGNRALITFYQDQKFIPFGSNLLDENTNSQAIIGEDGTAYITGLSQKGIFKIALPDNSVCYADYDFSTENSGERVIVTDIECNIEG